jgi:hypothetical protein
MIDDEQFTKLIEVVNKSISDGINSTFDRVFDLKLAPIYKRLDDLHNRFDRVNNEFIKINDKIQSYTK